MTCERCACWAMEVWTVNRRRSCEKKKFTIGLDVQVLVDSRTLLDKACTLPRPENRLIRSRRLLDVLIRNAIACK